MIVNLDEVKRRAYDVIMEEQNYEYPEWVFRYGKTNEEIHQAIDQAILELEDFNDDNFWNKVRYWQFLTDKTDDEVVLWSLFRHLGVDDQWNMAID
jgi:hypothetical protein